VKFIAFSLSVLGLIWISLAESSSSEPKPAAPPKSKLALSIKPEHVADALHAVILSDREVYTRALAGNQASLGSAERTLGAGKALPSPCEMLRLGSQAAASKGVEFSYVLRSLDPVNKRNAPETEIETKGLQFVATRPDLTFTSDELLGGRWYFTAVYPDVASDQSCIACHNRLRRDRTKGLKLGDVMGGLVVRIALEL
jgi:hypothetical protein